MSTLWYKNAIVYSLDVETFLDADGDGIGDFRGLTQQLDYLGSLGITCLWLLPFYSSPNRDNGYDIIDYYSVDPRLGNLGDFVEFMYQARERGIRVMVDLVINHTSIQHPWFQEARRDRHSKYRDYYVWSEHPEHDPDLVAFPHVEESIWEYDPQAEAYYLHHFYKEQPDLNITNPAVQEEIRRIMGFWLELGVSGFRVDAAPFVINGIGLPCANQTELQHFLTEMREFVRSRRGDAVLLAEANVPPDQVPIYFGQGDRMHLLFNFLVNQAMFLALAHQSAAPLQAGLQQLPATPEPCQWLNFVRHHDELTLDRLTEAQRQEIYQAFAPETRMQIFGRGIRRRLPPMLAGDRRRIELVYSLMFSLPGTPLLRYGEEIGMGDDLSLEGRSSVRTPMQWSDEPNAGFSSAPPEALPRPVIDQGAYRYQQVNVIQQQRHLDSLLNWMELLIRTRRQCPELGQGEWEILATDQPAVFAHARHWLGRTVIALHNLADQSCVVTLKSRTYTHLLELLSDRDSQPLTEDRSATAPTAFALAAYGYGWFRANPRP